MNDFLKRKEAELCLFYGVTDIRKVIDKQKEIFEEEEKNGTGSEENNI